MSNTTRTTTHHPRCAAQDEAARAARTLRANEHADDRDEETSTREHDALVTALVNANVITLDEAANATSEPDDVDGVFVLLPSNMYVNVDAEGRVWRHEPSGDGTDDEPRATWGV